MSIEERVKLINRRPTEEIVTNEQLLELIKEKKKPKAYIGYEISGLVHIGTYLTILKVKDLIKAGFDVTVLLADYHSWINKKMGGDLEKIQYIANNYFKKIFELAKADVTFVMGSEIYDNDYWKDVIEIMNKTTVARMKRTLRIMGRSESDSMPSSWFVYPAMQAADIFKLNVDVALAGMDQRKIHMLVREVSEKLNYKKPVAVHTHLLPSLKSAGRMDVENKMSKSIPGSAIFVHDSVDDIKRKIKTAYCPAGDVENNPIIDIFLHIIARDDSETITIERPEKFGGPMSGKPMEIVEAFKNKEIHPLDIKSFVASKLSDELKPIREYFETNRDIIEEIQKGVSR